MIKKLRIKFLIIAMISVILVLGVIISAINISNYVSVRNDADNSIKLIQERGMLENNFKPNDDNGKGMNMIERDQIRPEFMFETRFFYVKYVNDTADVNTQNINAISSDTAKNMADEVIKSGNLKGYNGIYRYNVIDVNNYKTVIFLDCSRGLDNASSFLKSSLIISIIGVLLVFVILLIASKYVFKPVDNAYQSQKRFISNASHELKTPLAIISTNNELLEIEKGEDESTKAISKQVNKLNNMVYSLSLLTKLSEIGKIDKPDDINLAYVLTNAIDSISSNDIERLKFDVTLDNDIIYKGNKELFTELISILIDNALKYAKTYINISLYKNNKDIVLEFMNDSYEMEDGNHNEVFERFYRNDNIRSDVEGSGIGLSIAKEIIDLHHAKIEAIAINNNFKISIIL